jgi:hypothetical protein
MGLLPVQKSPIINWVNYLISKIAAIKANTNTSMADQALQISAKVNQLL